VTTLRIMKQPGVCLAPQFVAEELLGAEGFTDVRYISTPGYAGFDGVTRGEIDFAWDTAARVVTHVDAGVPITALAGVHSGCYELFAHEPIRTISDLKGKRVGISNWGAARTCSSQSWWRTSGSIPTKDINWVTPGPTRTPMQLFAERQADAFLGFAPEPQELRARTIGHAILNMATDKPWSQYFCCTVFGNRDFVRAHPIATKRCLRAILKAADICAAEPERVARQLVDEGVTDQYDYALQTLTEVPYKVWREFDQEDSMRFYALRLREVDMIKSTPNEILAQGTDWRFLNELKHELKA
jgi:NitT/TauT family transport system substrate-binding protein